MFSTLPKTNSNFSAALNCGLQLLSIQNSLKKCGLVRVKFGRIQLNQNFREKNDVNEFIYFSQCLMGGGASLEDRVLQKTSLNMDKSKEDSSSQNDEVPGDLPVFPKKKMLGRRPSEMVRSVLTLQKEQFEELEKKTLLRNPRLKKVFQGIYFSFLACLAKARRLM